MSKYFKMLKLKTYICNSAWGPTIPWRWVVSMEGRATCGGHSWASRGWSTSHTCPPTSHTAAGPAHR